MTLFYKHKLFLKQLRFLPAIALCLLFISNTVYADKSYIKCWKNSEGLTECGNRVPREYYNQRVRYIDDQGVTRKVKEKDKSKEELESQKEQDKLLALEAKRIRKAKDYDDVLLKTYLTIDDLLASLNSRLDIIKSRSVILDSSIEIKKRKFAVLVRKAADMERSGKKISNQLAIKLDTARKDLKNLQAQVKTQELNMQKIKSVFAYDVERFILSKSNRIKHSLSTPSQSKKLHAVRLSCLNKSQCDSHWEKANKFIKEFATTDILYTTNNISVTDIPVKQQDIAMSLSILGNKSDSKKMIIFQIRCNPERKGQEFCSGEEVSGILKEFKSIIYQ
jgi:hypothetical protein